MSLQRFPCKDQIEGPKHVLRRDLLFLRTGRTGDSDLQQ